MSEIKIKKQEGHDFLYIKGDLWMTTNPWEKRLQKYIAEQAHGDVLIAGYGLGVVQKFLQESRLVSSVTSVEINPEIMALCEERYRKIHGRVILGDFYKFPENIKYDCVIGDIAQEMDSQFLEDYKMFKEKAEKLIKPEGKILAWGQDFFEYLIEKEKGK